jgi:hypothetical protein
MTSSMDGVAPLKLLTTADFKHFDKQGNNLSRMGRFMTAVKYFPLMRGVWKPQKSNELLEWRDCYKTVGWCVG